MINTKTWSDNRYVWSFAILIAGIVILYSIILYALDIYMSAGYRAVFILFILIGLLFMVRTYSNNNPSVNYIKAFVLCMKTGFCFVLFLLPIIFIYMEFNHFDTELIKTKEASLSSNMRNEVVLSTIFEMDASIILLGMCVAFMAEKKNKQEK